MDLITSSAILNALELRGDDALSLLRVLRKRLLRLDAVAYNAAMKGCDWRTAETLLREMQQDLVAEGGGNCSELRVIWISMMVHLKNVVNQIESAFLFQVE